MISTFLARKNFISLLDSFHFISHSKPVEIGAVWSYLWCVFRNLGFPAGLGTASEQAWGGGEAMTSSSKKKKRPPSLGARQSILTWRGSLFGFWLWPVAWGHFAEIRGLTGWRLHVYPVVLFSNPKILPGSLWNLLFLRAGPEGKLVLWSGTCSGQEPFSWLSCENQLCMWIPSSRSGLTNYHSRCFTLLRWWVWKAPKRFLIAFFVGWWIL